ncbi:beta-ketoacyl synthase N-terminal-like domain-containing protein [Kitasatospora purpeofusca]|uniref:beta-ketoacyl synthase N-terminal-like domain-containing protein n=1 Tax=Kitasatospora purpeofusca TaxID=67352 RepID=UPI00364A185B
MSDEQGQGTGQGQEYGQEHGQGQDRIAIVGMGIRLPGAGRDLDRYWHDIKNGVESISFFSREQLLGWGVPEEVADNPNFIPARAVLDDYDHFDHRLFGYSPQDAVLMDPQQRILLECAWGALEHAGYPPIGADGNRTAVYVGTGMNVYLLDILWPNVRAVKSAGGLGVLTSSDKDYAATRIAYKLNLQGAAFSVQTACSTSLVAIHLAVQSLLTYEADMVLAGAASSGPPTRRGHFYAPGGTFSRDGHCRTFDVAADGTADADGGGVLVLKRLEDAIRDNDTVHAVIAGTAAVNDGARKAGFTAPGVEGQATTIRTALAAGGIDPDTIGLIETHGTATPLGDPIELAALRSVFGTDRGDRPKAALGALKSIMGHLDTAAGVAAVIKTVLALKHRTIPPVGLFTAPNPALELEKSVFWVPDTATEWPTIDGVRRAGVSSFGIGGTNTHIVLEEAPPAAPRRPRRPASELLLVSARTEEAAAESLARVDAFLADLPPAELGDVAHTLRTGRTELPWRGFTVRMPEEDLKPLLPVRRTDPSAAERGVAYHLTGGGQLPGCGHCYHIDPDFRRIIDLGYAALRPLGEDADPAAKERVGRFAVAMAWTDALGRRGIRPVALTGNGPGAVAAACTAGVFDFATGIELALGRRPSDWRPAAPTARLHSPADGAPVTAAQAADADYWAGRFDEPGDGVFAPPTVDPEPATWLEVGTQVFPHLGVELPEMSSAYDRMLAAVGLLWQLGIGGPWNEEGDRGRSRVPAPGYPFAPTRHYLEIPATAKERHL